MTITKEKQYVNFNTEKGVYKIDLNNQTIIGLRGKPIENLSSAMNDLLDYYANKKYNNEILIGNDLFTAMCSYLVKCTFTQTELKKALKENLSMLDKLNALGFKIAYSDLRTIYSLRIKFSEKEITKIAFNKIKNDTETTIDDVKEYLCSKEYWFLSKNIVIPDYFTDDQKNILYDLLRYVPDKYIAHFAEWYMRDKMIFKSCVMGFTSATIYYDTYSLSNRISSIYRISDIMDVTPNNKNSFYEEMYRIHRDFEIFTRKKSTEKWEEIQKFYSPFTEIENEKYQIILPTCGADLIKEGRQLNHCVGSYVSKVENFETMIIFVREKKNPTKAYVTAEIRNNKVYQYLGKNDRVPTETGVQEFKKQINEFLKNWK